MLVRASCSRTSVLSRTLDWSHHCCHASPKHRCLHDATESKSILCVLLAMRASRSHNCKAKDSWTAHSFTDTKHLHPQQPWERNLGDCHFETLERFFTPVQNQPGRVRTAAEEEYNAMLQHVRARVEHINRTIKAHAMFTGVPYRGYVRNLAVFVKITLHATAELLRQRRIKFGPRYEGFGPHWHNPAQRDE